MGKRRITTAELTIGTILPWDAYDEQGRLLLRRGLEITSMSQVAGLLERGLYAAQDPARETPPAVEKSRSAVALILEGRSRLQHVCGPTASKEACVDQIMRIRELIRQACEVSQDAALAM